MFVIDTPSLSRAAAAERWRSLGAVMPEEGRPETDQYGELLLAPLPTNRHQRIAGLIVQQLREQLGGLAWTSVAINTRIGVRVPDGCWSDTPERFDEDPTPTAPEICVEVASPGNTAKWLLEKAAAYLDAGAREVIVVELDGRIRFCGVDGEQASSAFGLVLTLATGGSDSQ